MAFISRAFFTCVPIVAVAGPLFCIHRRQSLASARVTSDSSRSSLKYPTSWRRACSRSLIVRGLRSVRPVMYPSQNGLRWVFALGLRGLTSLGSGAAEVLHHPAAPVPTTHSSD